MPSKDCLLNYLDTSNIVPGKLGPGKFGPH